MENKLKKQPIRILNIVPNMRAAGIESFIMNVYRNIDRNKVQFDFIVHNKEKNFYDDEIERLGGKIYRFSFKDDKNIIKYVKDLNNFFKEHKEYKIVHGHMQSMMPLYLFIAKKNKVPIRIAHAHNGNYEKTIKGFILHVFSRLDKKFSTNNWACSKIAGEYLFNKKKFDIVYNGVNVEKFEFNKEIRNKKRKELNLEDKFTIVHIGRFELQKNHKFLINVFEKYLKYDKSAILLLIGEGKLEDSIKRIVKKKKLGNNIKFLGIRKDVNEIMHAGDCFLLPSLYEGLPVVGVEAQYSQMNCIFSNKITNELKISSKSYFEDIKKEKNWVEKIYELKDSNNRNEILNDKFNIKKISKDIQERYERYEKMC